ncbi:MAG: hypothetical protein LBG52_06925 [Candidatus Peribacteria bacterium]|nr:hypothetical protein [Candidatus Peribacteria bacterium]
MVGDVVRAYSRVTGDYAEHTVAYLDYDNDLVGFATTLPDWATVANKTKIELVQKAIAYGTPQLFGLKNVKIKVGDTIAEARTGEEMDVNTLTLNIANNIESNSGTKYNTSKETGGDYTFDVEMLFTNLKNRDIFRNKEEQALIITIDNGNVINASDPTQTYKIEIEIYRFVYETQEIPTASGGLLTESAT